MVWKLIRNMIYLYILMLSMKQLAYQKNLGEDVCHTKFTPS